METGGKTEEKYSLFISTKDSKKNKGKKKMGKGKTAYAECLKIHESLGGKADGCQEFLEKASLLYCDVCGCHRNFHKKVVEYETEVVYTVCHKNRNLQGSYSNDGCREFKWNTPANFPVDCCAACGCHLNFHRNEIVKPVKK